MAFTDNIVDAPELTADGATHQDTASNVGATEETNENAFIGWPTVWAKIDLSGYPSGWDVPVTLQATGDSGFEPYMEVVKVDDATFDPSSPDFTKLAYMSGTFLGDGTDTPPLVSFTLDGGSGSGSLQSETGIFYVFFTDWNFAGSGSATIEWSIEAEPLCIDAIDVLNPDASSRFDGTSASLTGDGLRVVETWDKYYDRESLPSSVEDWSLKWTWAGTSGQYKVSIFGQMSDAPGGTSRQVYALFRINGKMMTSQGKSGSAPSGTTDPFSWEGFDGLVDPTDFEYTADGIHQYPWLPLQNGDQIEVMLISAADSGSGGTPAFEFIPFECEQICFILDSAAPTTVFCTGLWDFEDHPLGDVWGSPNGWGGQKLIPDEIWTHLGITPYDENEFPWGVDYVDYDMAALEDGTVYVIFKDGWNHGLSQGPTNPDRKTTEYHYTVIKKYDPGADDWTQIATVNTHTPTEAYRLDGVSCEAGPDGFVYFAFWEAEEYNYQGEAIRQLWQWHCLKLDPSDDSYVELGTGQNAFDPTAASFNLNYTFDTLASHILPMEDGTVYVATIEDGNTNVSSSPGQGHKIVVWKWDGSTWTNLNVPDPSDTGTDTWFEVNGENQLWDKPPTMVAARHGDGPVTDGFTLVYPYSYENGALEGRQGVTISYTEGVGWHDEILSDWSTLLYTSLNFVGFTAKRLVAFDVDILWSEELGRLVLATDFVGGGQGEAWMIWQMNDGGTQWEAIEDCPPSVAGAWRQCRNSTGIGPDGNIYRAVMSEWTPDSGGVFSPMLVKHAPDYGVGWSNAGRLEAGQVTNKTVPWSIWNFSTTNYKLRIVGNTAYVIMNFYAESTDFDNDGEFADAFFVFRLSYVPCVAGIGDIKFP